MKSLIEDEFIYNRLLYRLTKEVKKEQLNKTISAIEELNKKQDEIIRKQGLKTSLNKELELINKKENAKTNNL